MFFPSRPHSPVSSVHAQAQLATATGVAEHALHAVAELTELNLAAAAASLQDSRSLFAQMMGARDPSQALQALQAEAQPAAEKMVSYARHAGEIGVQAQSEAAKAVHGLINESLAQFNDFVATQMSAAPAGTEPFAETVRALAANMHGTHEKLAKVNQLMLDGCQRQVAAISEQFVPNAAPVKPVKAKKAAAAATTND